MQENNTQLNTLEILKNLLGKLNKKEKDILSRRFGFKKSKKETLEAVGKLHNLTRERIRQIENASINKLIELKELENNLLDLKEKTEELLKEHGGLMEKDYLFHLLNNNSPIDRNSDEYEIEKNHYDFLLSRLLSDNFEEIKNSDKFKQAYKLKQETLEHMEEMAHEVLNKIEELKETYRTDDLINIIIKESEAYKKHEPKYLADGELDVSSYWADDLFDEDQGLVNKYKGLYSLLQALKEVEQNKFGFWGRHDWGEVKPKTINDKIYLILKNENKPLHFVDIAKRINEVGFDKKVANPATVHNELILDEKYVLVGRGIYGLKEWGYKEGIVLDVIKQIMAEQGEPMTKEEVVEKVLENRLVKRTTINLALMNKEVFEKTSDGKYALKA
ncbi:hypothetical protein GF382_03525 [Candidatus Falkowbacteria bacterium]|nr:hypothetical protein [Candidatus Falkowbacteria bacterium]